MKTSMAILLALLLLIIGVLVVIGYFLIEWIVPLVKEYSP
jgi:hypothetical protein